MTLAVAALFAKGPTRIRNVYNWRVKVLAVLYTLGLSRFPDQQTWRGFF